MKLQLYTQVQLVGSSQTLRKSQSRCSDCPPSFLHVLFYVLLCSFLFIEPSACLFNHSSEKYISIGFSNLTAIFHLPSSSQYISLLVIAQQFQLQYIPFTSIPHTQVLSLLKLLLPKLAEGWCRQRGETFGFGKQPNSQKSVLTSNMKQLGKAPISNMLGERHVGSVSYEIETKVPNLMAASSVIVKAKSYDLVELLGTEEFEKERKTATKYNEAVKNGCTTKKNWQSKILLQKSWKTSKLIRDEIWTWYN